MDANISIGRAIARIREARARGDGFAAFDVALKALRRHPGSLALAYHAVLQAARAGALSEASRLFDENGVAERAAAGAADPFVSQEDLLSLAARLAKDQALEAARPDRATALAAAADLYLEVFARTGGAYPLINAATLLALAGQQERAEHHARQTLALLADAAMPQDPAERFWYGMTGLEATLVLGDISGAAAAARGSAFHGDYGDLAVSIRQLTRLVTARKLAFDVGAALAMPGVLAYAGQMNLADEASVAASVAAVLDAGGGFRWAYGSLAAGADIVIVEALLARGIEVHIVLPFAEAAFIERSVRPAGERWVARFRRARARVTSCRLLVEGGYFGDDGLFAAASAYAIGLARLQVLHLSTRLTQLLVWDGVDHPGHMAGTAADWRLGQRLGLLQRIISVPSAPGTATAPPRGPTRLHRARAMIFTDVVGFSRIDDDDLPAFHSGIMSAMAAAITALAEPPGIIETWGDAVFLVYDDVVPAAAAAMALLNALRSADRTSLHLPPHLNLRVSAHFAPALDVVNPFTQRPACLGRHVSRAARIEPVTPPGVVYVTEAFAARLGLQSCGRYRADFVGTTKLAKKFGALPVFRLINLAYQP